MKISTLTVVFDHGDIIYNKLYEHIKKEILSGKFVVGDKLPSSRRLAKDLEISRTSVLNAYNKLGEEGFLTSQVGSGYKVIYEDKHNLLQRGKNVSPGYNYLKNTYKPFNIEPMDMTFFPKDKMSKIISRIGKEKPLSLIYSGQFDKLGSVELRHEICKYMYEKKGVNCTIEQVVITSGSQEAFEICIKLITEPGNIVSLEDPCFPMHSDYLINNLREVDYLQIDEQGVCCYGININSKVVFITPECQFPLGIIMSRKRKLEFIQWATKNEAWIIENDYDSNSNIGDIREPTVFSLDENHRTLYSGNFSRVIEKSLGIGYVILPEYLINKFNGSEYITKTSYFPQIVLAEFMRTGEFYRNLLKARKICGEKRNFFFKLLHDYISLYGYICECQAGSAVTFILNPLISDIKISTDAQDKGIEIQPLSTLCHKNVLNGLLLGFVYFTRDSLKKSVIQLRDILASNCQENNIDVIS